MDLIIPAMCLGTLAAGYCLGRAHAAYLRANAFLEERIKQVTDDHERIRREVAQFDFEAAEKRQRRFKL